MKTNVNILVILLLSCFLVNCSDDKGEERILLEETELIEIPREGGTYVVKSAEYPDWWLIGVYVQRGNGEKEELYRMGRTPSSPAYRDGVVSGEGCTIRQDPESGDMICRFDANEENEDKTFYIHMEEENFFPRIVARQKGAGR